MSLLSDINKRNTDYNNPVQADLGTWHGWAGSVRSGYKESVTSVGINWMARGYAGHLDRENGLEALDTEAFEKQYGKAEKTGFEFMKDETPSQAELRFQDFIDTQVQQRRMQSIGGVGQFAGGMIGNMASPVDMALTMVPYAGAMKMAKATSISIRTGKNLGKSAKIVDRLAAQKKNFLTTQMLANEGKALTKGQIFKEITKRGFQEQAAEAAFVMIGSHEIGRDYGMLDASADLVFGGILLSAINMPATFRMKKIADDIGNDLLNAHTMDTMAEGGNIRGLIGQVQQYTKSIGENSFGQKLDASPRIKAILEMPQSEFEADLTARHELIDFLYTNRESVWVANLKGVVPLDTRLSIPEARRKQHYMMTRIIEHQVRKNPDVELTAEEWDVVRALAQKNQDLMDLVNGRPRSSSTSTAAPKPKIKRPSARPKVEPTIESEGDAQPLEILQAGDPVTYGEYEGTLTFDGDRMVIETSDGALVDVPSGEHSLVKKTGDRIVFSQSEGTFQINGVGFKVDDPDTTIEIDADGVPVKATLVGPNGARTEFTNPDTLYRIGSELHAQKVASRRGDDISPRREDAFDEETYKDATVVYEWSGAWDTDAIETIQKIEEGQGAVSLDETLHALQELQDQGDFVMELDISEARKMEVLEELYETEQKLITKAEEFLDRKARSEIPLRGEAPNIGRKARRKKRFRPVPDAVLNSPRKRKLAVKERLDEDSEAAPAVREAEEELLTLRKELRNAKRRKNTPVEEIERRELDVELAKENLEAREREFLEQGSEVQGEMNLDSTDPLIPDPRLDKEGYYGERPSDFKDEAGNTVDTSGNKLWRGVYWEPKVNKDGALIIPSRRDEMFSDRIGEKEGRGSSFTGNPNEAAHYAVFRSEEEVRTQGEEIADESEFHSDPIIIEIDKDAVEQLEFLEGTEGGELRFQHDGDLIIPKGKYRVLRFNEFSGDRPVEVMSSFGSNESLFSRNQGSTDPLMPESDSLSRSEKPSQLPFTRRDSEDVTQSAYRFLAALGFKVPVKAKRKEGSMAHYSPKDGTIYLDPDVRPDRALQLVFHELVHYFKNKDAITYEKLNSVVARFLTDKDFMDKILSPELRKRYLYNFYEEADKIFGADLSNPEILGKVQKLAKEKITEEEVAWFMTEATKHPEFWKALKQRDENVFKQFRLWLIDLWNMIKGNRRIDRSKMTADQKKAMQEFGEIVAAAEAADGGSRGQGSMDSLDPDANTPRPNLEKIQAEARKTQEAIEKDTETARQQSAARQEEAAKEVEEEAAKVEKTPMDAHKKGIKANISDEFGDMAADTNTDPENIAGKIKEYLGKLGSGRIYQDMKALGDRVISLKRLAKTRYEHTRSVLEVKNLDPDPSVLGEVLAMRLHGIKRKVDAGEITAKQGLDEMTEAIDADSIQGIYTEIRDLQIQNRDDAAMEGLSQKLKLKFIKSAQDGLQRMGINLGRGSVAAEISAQMTKDMAKMRKVFIDEGFINYLDNTIDRVAGKDIPDAALRHKARVDASNKFMIALMHYYRTGEVDPAFKDNADSFRAVGDAMRDTLHSQVAQINELGGGITLRQDHGGLAYRWDNDTLRRMGLEGFKERARKMFDAEKIKEAHGGMMVGKTNDAGFAETLVEFDFEDWLEAFYREATSPVKNADHSSMDIAKSFSKSRMVHVKEGMELEALTTFSGHENLGRLLQDQIRHRSEMIAISKTMGNKPLPNFLAKLERHGLAKGINTTREPTGSKLDRLLVKTGFEEKVHDLDIKHAIDTAKFQTGALDNPASHDVSFWGKTYRQVSHLAFLWTSTISAINDVPLALMTLDQMGGGASLLQLTGAMQRAASRRFNGEGDKVSQFYEGWGAGMDSIVNAGARRLALMEANGDSMVAKMSESMFTVNGLNFWTAMMQEAFADVLTSNMGRMAKTGDWDIHMKFTMESMGIRGDDFKKMEDAIRDVNGVDRLSVHDLGDSELQDKLLTFFATFRDQAVIVPDASTQALVRFGTQSGTFMGEAVRSVFQYAAFPIAMNRITQRKLMMNHGGTRPWTQGQLGLQRMITYMGAMAAFSYLSIILKDLSRGRGPVMPWEMSGDTAMRMMDQSGIMGAAGNIIQGGLEGRPSAVVSPNVSTQFRMANKLMTEGFGSALYAGRAYTGDNIPFAGDAITSGIAYAMHFTTIDSLQKYGRDARVSRNFLEQRGIERLMPLPE